MAGNLTKRVLFAVVAIPAAAGVLWLGGWWLAAAVAALAVLGAREVYDLAARQGIAPLRLVGYGGAAVLPLAAYGARSWPLVVEAAPYLAVIWLLKVLVLAMARGPGQKPLAAVSITVFGALYASAPLAFLVTIRHGPAVPLAGFALVLLPLALTWICDTAAFMAGSQFGGPKMAPVLSPRKTWSGAVGGVAGALLAAVLLGALLPRTGSALSLAQLLGLGLMVGVVGQVGDVAESLLKREAGVKDSSNLIPGHGGVLDRLDSLYFVIPASAALYRLYGAI
jgi:phosphatidate cytidylyltransferase